MSDHRTEDPVRCEGCGHLLSQHYRDVRGVARCMVVTHGETTSGVIGLPYTHHCQCEEFKCAPPPETQEQRQQRMASQVSRAMLKQALRGLKAQEKDDGNIPD